MTTDRLRAVPFVGPIHHFNGQYLPVDDGCPLRASERQIGHEAQTLLLAMELAARSDQLVFGPAFAAYRYEPLYLVCNVNRLKYSDQRTMVMVLREAIARMGGSDRPREEAAYSGEGRGAG